MRGCYLKLGGGLYNMLGTLTAAGGGNVWPKGSNRG